MVSPEFLVYREQRRAGFDHLHYMSFQPEQDIKRLLMPNGREILLGRHYFNHIRYENRGAKVMLLKQAFSRH